MDIQEQIKLQQLDIQYIKDQYKNGHLYICDEEAYHNDLKEVRKDLHKMIEELKRHTITKNKWKE